MHVEIPDPIFTIRTAIEEKRNPRRDHGWLETVGWRVYIEVGGVTVFEKLVWDEYEIEWSGGDERVMAESEDDAVATTLTLFGHALSTLLATPVQTP